jgi:hypothetical protein
MQSGNFEEIVAACFQERPGISLKFWPGYPVILTRFEPIFLRSEAQKIPTYLSELSFGFVNIK